MSASTRAEQAGRQANDSEWMDHAVRVGLVAYGIVHLLIAWLAFRLVFGEGGKADSSGAFGQLAQTTPGRISLYVVAGGFAALVVWQLLEAGFGHRDEEGAKRAGKRAVSVGKAVIYGTLGVSAFRGAQGSSGGGGTDGLTAKLMSLPAGPLVVGAVGVGILVVAGVLAYRGGTEKFRSKLEVEGQTGKDGRAYILFGKIGYVAKAVALSIIGVLFLYAAFTTDPSKSGGLDEALKQLLQQPFGGVLLGAVALGLGCFGLFCFAWARHLDRS